MQQIRKKNRIGTEFTYYTCEDDKCNYEIPLCYCDEIAQNIISKKYTYYYVCSQNNCNFIIANWKATKYALLNFQKNQIVLDYFSGIAKDF